MVMKKKKKLKMGVRRFFAFGITSVFLIGTLSYTIGNYWIQIIAKNNEKKELSEKLKNLKKEEETLEVDVKKLQDPDYIARYAREKFLYSKEKEFIIRIPGVE